MPAGSILNLDLPTFSEIKAEKALKSVRYPQSPSGLNYVIYPNMNSLQEAILRALGPQTEPSSDPNMSSLVAAGYTWLGTTIAEPDLQVKKGFQRKRNGKKRDDDLVDKHRFYELLAFDGRPNPYTSASTLWRAWAYSWIISGNSYFLKFRNAFGQVAQLWYEPHFTIKARWVNDKNGEYIPADRSTSSPLIARNDDSNQFINYYELTRDSQAFRVEPQDVVHFRDGIDPFNTRYGLSRLTTILREIYQDSAVASYAAKLMGGSGVIPFVVGLEDNAPVGLNIEDMQNMKDRIVQQITGSAGDPVVLNRRHTFTRTALTPQELDLRASRGMAQDIFSAVTGIPAIVLNFSSGMERSIYANMSEADRRAVTSYLEPLWWHRDQELTHQLLRDLDPNDQLFIESDISEVGALKEDTNAVWERHGLAYEKGGIKRGEYREAIGFEAAEDGSDDVYYVRGGSETLTPEEEKVQREASIEATKNPPEPEMLPQGNEPRLLQAVNTQKRKQG